MEVPQYVLLKAHCLTFSASQLTSLPKRKCESDIPDAWFEPGFSRRSVRKMVFSASPFSEGDIWVDRKVKPGINRKECHVPFRKSICSCPHSFSQHYLLGNYCVAGIIPGTGIDTMMNKSDPAFLELLATQWEHQFIYNYKAEWEVILSERKLT